MNAPMSEIEVPRAHELNLDSLEVFGGQLSRLAEPYIVKGYSETFVNPVGEKALSDLKRKAVYEDDLRPLIQLRKNHLGEYSCSVHLQIQGEGGASFALEVFRFKEKPGMSGAPMLALALNEALTY